MTVVEAWRARLLSLTPVTNITSTRIRSLVFAQSERWPAVRLQQIGRIEFMHLTGSSHVYRARIQVDSVIAIATSATPYADAYALAEAVHGDGNGANATGMCGWKGDIGSPAFTITGILPDGAGFRDFFEEDEPKKIRIQHDYLTWFIR